MTELAKPPRARRGTGSVFERRPGAWYAQWSSKDPATGARKQHKKGPFPKESAARKFITEQLADVNKGTFIAPPKPKTVGETLDAWLASKTSVRPSTLMSYTVAADKWIRPHIGGVNLAALTEEQVSTWLAKLGTTGSRAGKPLSNRSRQLALITLRQAINFGIRRGWAVRNVAATVDGVARTEPKTDAWSAAEVKAFLTSVQDDRLYALWALYLRRGPRRGEALGLRWTHVDLDAKTAKVEETIILVDNKPAVSQPKVKRSRRSLPLGDMAAVLRAHRKRQLAERLAAGSGWHDTDYVFTDELGRPLNPEYVSARFDALVKASGVRRIRLHDTRHTVASLMLENGTAPHVVAAILGHDVKTLMSTYAHKMPGQARRRLRTSTGGCSDG